MLHTAIGVSDDIDIDLAVGEVIKQCEDQLDGHMAHAGILFSSCMDADLTIVLKSIHEAFPETPIIGCTTDGEITTLHGFSEDSIALLLLSSDNVHFSTSIATNISKDPELSIKAAFAEAKRNLQTTPKCAIVLPDGLTTAAIFLDAALRLSMGETFPIFGGTAGDHFQLKQTYQFHGGKIYSDAMPILLIGGSLELNLCVTSGLEPFGAYHRIEEFDNNVIYKIAGKSIVEFYKQNLGEFAPTFTNFPLAVYYEKEGPYFLRSPYAVDMERESMAFLGTLPDNCYVRLSQIIRDDIREAAQEANQVLLQPMNGGAPELILVFSCTTRRHVLGSQTNEEFSILQSARNTVPFFGFYCYGEIGPFALNRPTQFHHNTFTSVALSAR